MKIKITKHSIIGPISYEYEKLISCCINMSEGLLRGLLNLNEYGGIELPGMVIRPSYRIDFHYCPWCGEELKLWKSK